MNCDGNSSSVQGLIAILKKHSRPGGVINEEMPGRVSVSAGIDLNGVIEDLKELQLPEGLALRGKATDSIWVLPDGEEPHVFGLRLDCGDCGAVFLTREQARAVIQALEASLAQI
jgi:hypothetical protein